MQVVIGTGLDEVRDVRARLRTKGARRAFAPGYQFGYQSERKSEDLRAPNTASASRIRPHLTPNRKVEGLVIRKGSGGSNPLRRTKPLQIGIFS
jgi:hypothetical protein